MRAADSNDRAIEMKSSSGALQTHGEVDSQLSQRSIPPPAIDKCKVRITVPLPTQTASLPSHRLRREGEQVLLHGHYVVVQSLQSARANAVFEAVDVDLVRRVLLFRFRTSHGQHHATAAPGQPDHNEQIEAVRLLAAVDHPGLIQIYDLWTDERYTWVAAEEVDGPSIDQWMQAPKRPSLRAFLQVALASLNILRSLHARRIVHGALNGTSLRVDRTNDVRLVDIIERLGGQRSSSRIFVRKSINSAEFAHAQWKDLQDYALLFAQALEHLPAHRGLFKQPLFITRGRWRRAHLLFRRWSIAAYSRTNDPWQDFYLDLVKLLQGGPSVRAWMLPIAALSGILAVILALRQAPQPAIECEDPLQMLEAIAPNAGGAATAIPSQVSIRTLVEERIEAYSHDWQRTYAELCSPGDPSIHRSERFAQQRRDQLRCLHQRLDDLKDVLNLAVGGHYALAQRRSANLAPPVHCLHQHSHLDLEPKSNDPLARQAAIQTQSIVDSFERSLASPAETLTRLVALHADANRDFEVSTFHSLALANVAQRAGDELAVVRWSVRAYLSATASNTEAQRLQSTMLTLRFLARDNQQTPAQLADVAELEALGSAELARVPGDSTALRADYHFTLCVSAILDNRFDEAIRWGESSLAAASRLPETSAHRMIALHNNLAVSFDALGKTMEAAFHYQAALDVAQRKGTDDTAAACVAMSNVARVSLQTGNASLARQLMGQLIKHGQAQSRCTSTFAATAWWFLALQAQQVGWLEYTQHFVGFGLSAIGTVKLRSTVPPELAPALQLLRRQSMPDKMAPLLRELPLSLAAVNQLEADNFKDWWLTWYFELALSQGNVEQARSILTDAASDAGEDNAYDSIVHRATLDRLRAALAHVTKHDRLAETHLIMARDALLQRFGQDSLLALPILEDLAHVQADLDDWKAARDAAQQALELSSPQLGPESPRLLPAWTALAAAQWALGEPTKARSALQRAQVCWESASAHSLDPRWPELLARALDLVDNRHTSDAPAFALTSTTRDAAIDIDLNLQPQATWHRALTILQNGQSAARQHLHAHGQHDPSYIDRVGQ